MAKVSYLTKSFVLEVVQQVRSDHVKLSELICLMTFCRAHPQRIKVSIRIAKCVLIWAQSDAGYSRRMLCFLLCLIGL